MVPRKFGGGGACKKKVRVEERNESGLARAGKEKWGGVGRRFGGGGGIRKNSFFRMSKREKKPKRGKDKEASENGTRKIWNTLKGSQRNQAQCLLPKKKRKTHVAHKKGKKAWAERDGHAHQGGKRLLGGSGKGSFWGQHREKNGPRAAKVVNVSTKCTGKEAEWERIT